MNKTFANRHIGPNTTETEYMLSELGLKNLDELVEKTLPQSIKQKKELNLPAALSEPELLMKAKGYAQQNMLFKNFIGMGYYNTQVPSVIQRNILENPSWYTAYTPYQAEISQGRMQALLNYQSLIMDLTGMSIANASLLDEGTAAAEAMTMTYNLQKKNIKNKIFVDQNIFPQTLEVLQTRAWPLDLNIEIGDVSQLNKTDDYFALLVQYPGANGQITIPEQSIVKAKATNTMVIVIADLLSLTLLKPPGEWGADVVVGNSQRFGVPMGFGGPHAAFFATHDEYKRSVPGRIIGVSKDKYERPALRLSLQTREQHIKREKATSNICTAQVLLAVMASMYAVYHGPDGLRDIAGKVHEQTRTLYQKLKSLGYDIINSSAFDTISIKTDKSLKQKLKESFESKKINLNYFFEDEVRLSLDENTSVKDLEILYDVFKACIDLKEAATTDYTLIAPELLRKTAFLQAKVFHTNHSETKMLRYIKSLEKKDISLTDSMIALGSCTMKLNATTEMLPISWPEFSDLHPFAPVNQTKGYRLLVDEFKSILCEITGYHDFSLQPNAGSQGEYAGLLVIKKYFDSINQSQRNICLIPSSAHGTNPASAVMAGFKVIVVKCDEQGNIDIEDLKQKANHYKNELAALMVTYPSTHGVFEEEIVEICNITHEHGGQVYMDGANLNALVGLAQPGAFGSDVSHLNLHKTFCIPHGGGGPGVGPIGVREHLTPFLPKSDLVENVGPKSGIGTIASSPYGSASILPISWSYCLMMGAEGLKKATQVAILNANYIAKKLSPYYKILYKGRNNFVAHECIVDFRDFKKSAGITIDDVAKRLMDFGFHAPTMSWPVVNTLMIEPTESEDLSEINRFIEAMIQIRKEIDLVENKTWPQDDNPLVNAPHTSQDLLTDNWAHPYSREQALFPLPWVAESKYWPPVARVNNAFGDRNLVCSCLPLEAYQQELR